MRGRESKCGTLRGLIWAVESGRCGVLVLRGEAGVGRAALLEHVSEMASGPRCIHVAGVRSDIELAFAGLRRLCAPLLHDVDEFRNLSARR